MNCLEDLYESSLIYTHVVAVIFASAHHEILLGSVGGMVSVRYRS